ncbi:EAL domain-containing protein [Stella sp.]|uniref:EAL domain-containing protein n=1 Tax=Stella sp. TaxID=2912054 RepID=UPI0035B2061A
MTVAAPTPRRAPIDNDRLNLLLGAHEDLAAEREPDAVLATLCRLVCMMVDARWAAAVIRDPDGRSAPRLQSAGMPEATAAALRQRIAGWEPFDGAAGMRRLAPAEAPPGLPPFRFASVVPLGDGVLHRGWLCVGDPVLQRPFDAQDEAVLEDLSAMAGRMFVLATLRRDAEHASAALAAEVEKHRRAERRLDIQYAVAAILAHTSSLDEAAPALIEAICSRLGFAFGILREIDRRRDVLRAAAVWHEPDPRIAEFAVGSQQQDFAFGSGITGHAWATGRPVWFDEGTASGLFRRSEDAVRAGLHAAAAFPIFASGEIVGVLSFLARDSRPLDPDLLEMFAAIGSQLGQFVERRRQEAEIEHLNRLYAVLSAVNRLLIQADNRDALFAGICRIAHEHGGFGIAIIAAYDPATDFTRPIAGAGEDFSAVASGAPRPFTATPAAERGEVARAVIEGRPVFENDLAAAPERGGPRRRRALEIGYAASAALPLRAGGRIVAVFVLFSRERGYFTDPIRRLLAEVADDVSFGLDHIENRDRLAYLASHDPVTGLPNRVLFEDRLGQALIAAGRAGTRVAAIFIDIRRFRDVTDSLGREAGERILREFGRRLGAVAQNPENLARLENDRFATFVPEAGDALAVARLIEQSFSGIVAEARAPEGEVLHLTTMIGVAVFPDDGTDAATLTRNGRAALRTAKETGRRYQFYEPTINARVAETLRMAGRLQLARARGEFFLHYQPKVAAKDGTVRGVEALIRWNDARTGMVAPTEFIPLLEESGLIGEVGLWVMRQALLDRRKWRRRDGRAPRVAVNVSVIQFQLPGFLDGVRALAAEFAEGPVGSDCGLDIEVTESLIMRDVEGTIAKLQELKRLGIGIAIDDFGTGHSSLAYLARLPIASLKIDRSFVRMMVESSESMLVISTIIALAHGLDLMVVAEGVETEEQARLLRLMRCDEFQGFLYGRPMSADEIAAALASG